MSGFEKLPVPNKEALSDWLYEWGQYISRDIDSSHHGLEQETVTSLSQSNHPIWYLEQQLSTQEKQHLKAEGIDISAPRSGQPLAELMGSLRCLRDGEDATGTKFNALDRKTIENAHEYFSKQVSCFPAGSFSENDVKIAWESYCEMLAVEPPPLVELPQIRTAMHFVDRYFRDDKNAEGPVGIAVLEENLQALGNATGLNIASCELKDPNDGTIFLTIDQGHDIKRVTEHNLRHFFTALCKGLNTELLESVKITGNHVAFTPACEISDIVLADAHQLCSIAASAELNNLHQDIHFEYPTKKPKRAYTPTSEPEDVIAAAFMGAKLGKPEQIDKDRETRTIIINLSGDGQNHKRVAAALTALASVGLSFTPLNEHGRFITIKLDNDIEVLEKADPAQVMDIAKQKLGEQLGRKLFEPGRTNGRSA